MFEAYFDTQSLHPCTPGSKDRRHVDSFPDPFPPFAYCALEEHFVGDHVVEVHCEEEGECFPALIFQGVTNTVEIHS